MLQSRLHMLHVCSRSVHAMLMCCWYFCYTLYIIFTWTNVLLLFFLSRSDRVIYLYDIQLFLFTPGILFDKTSYYEIFFFKPLTTYPLFENNLPLYLFFNIGYHVVCEIFDLIFFLFMAMWNACTYQRGPMWIYQWSFCCVWLEISAHTPKCNWATSDRCVHLWTCFSYVSSCLCWCLHFYVCSFFNLFAQVTVKTPFTQMFWVASGCEVMISFFTF